MCSNTCVCKRHKVKVSIQGSASHFEPRAAPRGLPVPPSQPPPPRPETPPPAFCVGHPSFPPSQTASAPCVSYWGLVRRVLLCMSPVLTLFCHLSLVGALVFQHPPPWNRPSQLSVLFPRIYSFFFLVGEEVGILGLDGRSPKFSVATPQMVNCSVLNVS